MCEVVCVCVRAHMNEVPEQLVCVGAVDLVQYVQ